MRLGVLVFLLALVVGCQIPFDVAPSKTTLRLDFDSPATANQAGSKARLAAPSTDEVTVTVLDADGKLVTKTTAVWNASTNSASVALDKVPLDKPLTIQAFTYAPNGTTVKDLTGAGTASVTIKAGTNTLKMVLVPQFFSDEAYTFGNSEYYEFNVGDWNLRQVQIPEGTDFITIHKPTDSTLFLQSPSGTVTPLFNAVSAIAVTPGTWNVLLWNQSASEDYGNFSIVATDEPDYNSVLKKLTIPSIEAGLHFELRLYDRPVEFSGHQLLRTLSFQAGETGQYVLTVPSWTIGPQTQLRVYSAVANAEFELHVLNLATEPNEPRELYVYDGLKASGGGKSIAASHQFQKSGAVVEGGVTNLVVGVDQPLPSPENLSGSLDGSTAYFTWDGLEDEDFSYYQLLSNGTVYGPFVSTSGSVDSLITGLNHIGVRGVWEHDVYTYWGPESAGVDIDTGGTVVTPTDTDGPAITFTSPGAGASMSDDTYVVSGVVSDPSGIYGAPMYSLDGVGWYSVDSFDSQSGVWIVTLYNQQSNHANYGTKNFQLQVLDNNSNLSESTWTFTTIADTTLPGGSISIGPGSLNYNDLISTGLAIQVYVNEPGGYSTPMITYVDGGQTYTTSMNPDGTDYFLYVFPPSFFLTNGLGTYPLSVSIPNYAGLTQTYDCTTEVIVP